MRKLGFPVLVLALSFGLQAPLAAQTDGEYFGIFNFRAQNPGARARGLGGAFVALADDATAAFINPAGLAFLDRWEVSAEYGHDEETREVAQLSGSETHGTWRESTSSEANSLDFASAVFPIKKGRLTAAAYYALLSPFDRNQGDFVYVPGLIVESQGTYFYDAFVGAFAKNEVFGASLGFRVSDKLSIGASLGQSTLDFFGQTTRYDQGLGKRAVNSQSSLVDNEHDYFATAGVIFQPSERFGFGFSWQKETSYDMTSIGYNYIANTTLSPISSKFTIPTRWALGMTVRATDSLIFSFEADRIEYSDLLNGMGGQTFFEGGLETDAYRFRSDDVTEYHVGTEYTFFVGSTGLSLRGGYWRDRTHLQYFAGTDAPELARQPRLDEAIDHYTVGLGLAFKHFMMDFAGDYSDYAGTDYLGSVVFRF